MVTAEILKHTFKIRVQGSDAFGTGFLISKEGRQYLVSANHVLDGFSAGLEIEQNGRWVRYSGSVVGASTRGDVAVLALKTALLPPAPKLGPPQLSLSEPLFFLGFPFGMTTWPVLNDGYPIPFVKQGIVSALMDGGQIGSPGFYLDAINNLGFSGGPVVRGYPSETILGVVHGYVSSNTETRDVSGKQIGTTLENSGIMLCYHIELAAALIEASPIGPSE